jgi:hypothetical protein
MHYAARNGNPAAMCRLLREGGRWSDLPVDLADENGTALWYAARGCRGEGAEADPALRGHLGRLIPEDGLHDECVAILVAAGADIALGDLRGAPIAPLRLMRWWRCAVLRCAAMHCWSVDDAEKRVRALDPGQPLETLLPAAAVAAGGCANPEVAALRARALGDWVGAFASRLHWERAALTAADRVFSGSAHFAVLQAHAARLRLGGVRGEQAGGQAPKELYAAVLAVGRIGACLLAASESRLVANQE